MPTQEQINEATAEFIRSTPDFGPYLTEANCAAIAGYVQGTFPDAILSVSAWEIAFKDLLATHKLKRIPNYIAPITDAQRELVAKTPSYIARDLYKTDRVFKQAFDLVAADEKDRQELLAWARTYKIMADSNPNETARRYVEEPGFKEAVEKLISEGLI